MTALIQLILKEKILKISDNFQVKELIELLKHSSEEEFKTFLNDFEVEVKKLPTYRIGDTQELLEYICINIRKDKNDQVKKATDLKISPGEDGSGSSKVIKLNETFFDLISFFM